MAESVSVPAPAELHPVIPTMSTADTVHDLMARRKEARKNRLKYHLTETDCLLLCTHGIDHHYQHGQLIAEEGQQIRTVYRIKSGRVCLQKQGRRLYNLTQGFFIGEGLFIHNDEEYDDYFGANLIANGPVTITEVNIPFVRQILAADKVLSFKVYRHIAGKLSALLLSVLGSVAVEEYIPSPKSEHSAPASPSSTHSDSLGSLPSMQSSSLGSLPDFYSVRSDSQSSLPGISTVSPYNSFSTASSVSSDSLVGGSTSGGSMPDLLAPPTSVIMTEDMVKEASTRAVKKKKKLRRLTRTSSKEKTPFKVYNLDSRHHHPVTCQLTSQKIILVSGAGIHSKRKIKYNKILDISRTGPKSCTIIYGVQARTLFFKTDEEFDEFYGIVGSLISSENKEMFTHFIAPNITQLPVPMPDPRLTSPPPGPEEVAASDSAMINQLATRQDFKRGDYVVAEGDLYQRIYTVVSGEIHMNKRGRHIVTLREGEVFGVLTLFHLRPSMMDIEVVSDTASLLIIPGYKINELTSTNLALAVRMHKKAAQTIYSQVGQILKSRDEVVEKFSDSNFFM